MRTFVLVAALALAALVAPARAQKDYEDHYESDMEAFLDEAQKSYPFFDLKDLRKEWSETKKRLEKEARRCKTDAEFMGLVYEGIAYLRDAHMTVTQCAVEMPEREPDFYPGLSFLPASEGRVVVMHPPQGQGAALETGTVVLEIDGRDAREVLDERGREAWEKGGFFSSPQRATFFEYRLPLRSERGTKYTLTCLDGKKKKKVKIASRTPVSGWPHEYHLPKDLKQVGRSFYYTKLPSGVGYMYLRRVDESIPQGMAEALAEHPDLIGWVVDLRGNTGGGYGGDLLAQVDALSGKRVAVLLDAGCISAGETLARDFVNRAGARLFGSTTAGSSSSKREWPFPSGIASVRFSTRGRSGLDGQGIEFLGIAPHEVVEAVPEELAEGLNTEILHGERYVLEEA